MLVVPLRHPPTQSTKPSTPALGISSVRAPSGERGYTHERYGGELDHERDESPETG